MKDCEHGPKADRIRLTDEECLSKVREILETPELECILCHAQHIKVGYDFWYAGPPEIARAIDKMNPWPRFKAWANRA